MRDAVCLWNIVSKCDVDFSWCNQGSATTPRQPAYLEANRVIFGKNEDLNI